MDYRQNDDINFQNTEFRNMNTEFQNMNTEFQNMKTEFQNMKHEENKNRKNMNENKDENNMNDDKNSQDDKNDKNSEDNKNDKNSEDDKNELISMIGGMINIIDDEEYDWKKDDQDVSSRWSEYRDKYGTIMPVGPLGIYDALKGPITVHRFSGKMNNPDSIEVRQGDRSYTINIDTIDNHMANVVCAKTDLIFSRRLRMNDALSNEVIRFNSYALFLRKEAAIQNKLIDLKKELKEAKEKLKFRQQDILLMKSDINRENSSYCQEIRHIRLQNQLTKERLNLEHELNIEGIDNEMRDLLSKLKRSCKEYVFALTTAGRSVKQKWQQMTFFEDGIDTDILKLKFSLSEFFAKYESEEKVSSEREKFHQDISNYYNEMMLLNDRRDKIFREQRRSDHLLQLKERQKEYRVQENHRIESEKSNLNLNLNMRKDDKRIASQRVATLTKKIEYLKQKS